MRKGRGFCCVLCAAMLLVSVSATARAEEHRLPEHKAYLKVHAAQEQEGQRCGHIMDAEGRLCNNSLVSRTHADVCRDIRIPERRYSNRRVHRFTRKAYLNACCCTSCGYVFSEEELAKEEER